MKYNTKIGLSIITMLVLFAIIGSANVIIDNDRIIIDEKELQNVEQNYAYVVYEDGGIYYAKCGSTGIIDYSGANRYIVIQNAVNNVNDGTVFVKDIWLLYSNILPLIKENVTILQDDKGVYNYYGLYGHLNGHPTITEDRPVIRFFCADNASKPIIEWRDHNNNKTAWIVAHNMLYENDVYLDHSHISIETSNTTGIVKTRFEISYGDDVAKIKFPNSKTYFEDTGIIFRKDTDTKVWRNADDDLRLTTGGTTRLQVTNNAVTITNALTLPTNKPTSGLVEGMVYYNTTSDIPNFYNGSVWKDAIGNIV